MLKHTLIAAALALTTTTLAQPYAVSFDTDGTILVNGKRTLIIGSYYAAKSDQPYKEMADAGFNLVRAGSPETLDQAQAAGVMAWTAVGAALELLFQLLPVAFGLRSTIDAGLARVLFSWTLHAIVYFWLMPTYIAYYTIVPRAIGGKIYSDTMARISFVLFLVVAMPIGIPSASRISMAIMPSRPTVSLAIIYCPRCCGRAEPRFPGKPWQLQAARSRAQP